ncbi:MAG: hypothetical protein AB8B93_06005 [Pseudomonadales bacterium]
MLCNGTDFSVELPEGSIDSSSYLFVLPIESSMTPNVLITKRLSKEPLSAAQAMQDYIVSQRRSLEDIEISDQIEGGGSDRDYALFIGQWCAGELAMRQKTIFLHFAAAATQVFSIALTSLAEDFDAAEPQFDQIVRNFKHQPNPQHAPVSDAG